MREGLSARGRWYWCRAERRLYYRPLPEERINSFRAWSELPAEWTLKDDPRYLDPTVPAVRQRILSDVRRFRDWGFRLVKIDYLTYDICRVWGRAMGDVCVPDGTTNWLDAKHPAHWRFADGEASYVW